MVDERANILSPTYSLAMHARMLTSILASMLAKKLRVIADDRVTQLGQRGQMANLLNFQQKHYRDSPTDTKPR